MWKLLAFALFVSSCLLHVGVEALPPFPAVFRPQLAGLQSEYACSSVILRAASEEKTQTNTFPKFAPSLNFNGMFNFLDLGLASTTLARNLDSLIAGLGLGVSMTALYALNSRLKVPVFCAPMMASGIIFFAGATPPDFDGFAKATLGALGVYNVLGLLRTRVPHAVVTGATAGCMLMWFKATNAIFPPSVPLGMLMAQAAPNLAAQQFSWAALKASAQYAIFPWITGNTALYLAAGGLSYCRAEVRNRVMKDELRALSSSDLRQTFNQFDTSGDGFLDPTELKVALRVAVGCDLPLEDCRRLVGEADADGDGVVDFHEFEAICKGR